MRKRGMGWRLMGAALAALALTGGMAARAARANQRYAPVAGREHAGDHGRSARWAQLQGTGGVLVSRVVTR